MPTIVIPPAFRGPTQGVGEIEVPVGNVRECLESVGTGAPGFLELCIDEEGNAQRWLTFFVNDTQLDTTDVLAVEIGKGDRLRVLAAVAGG